jgi:hypothetical protein
MKRLLAAVVLAMIVWPVLALGGYIQSPGATPQKPTGSATSAASAQEASSGPAEKHFAFWYEDWTPEAISKLQPANILVGASDVALPIIHRNGGRAIQYVTFYQSVTGRAFLKNSDDLSNVGFHTPQGYLPSAFGGNDNYVLCSNSAEMLRRALEYVNHSIGIQHFDGFFVDNAYEPPATTLVCDAKHPHRSPGMNGGSAYIELMKQVYPAVKKQNPDALLILNTGSPAAADRLTSGGSSAWDVADYVTWESYGYSSNSGPEHDRWPNTLKESFRIAGTPHAAKILALSYPRSYPEALYSYGVASAFGFTYSANLGESERGKPSANGGHFGVFSPSLPSLSGKPLDAPPAPSDTVLRRAYKNGIVFVNITAKPSVLVFPQGGTLYTAQGSSSVSGNSKFNLPQGQAVVIIYK